MKTLQTFALLILLFTAKTYCQDDAALEVDEGSIATEIKGPEVLPAVPDGETDSSILPHQDTPTEAIEVNAPASLLKEDENPVTIPETSESSSIATDSEPSSESPAETTQIVDEGITLSESVPEVSESTLKQQPSETIIPPHKEEETPATVPESPESSPIADEPEPSTESPTESPQIVDERTTLSQSVPEEQEVPESTSEQQPSEIIIPPHKEEGESPPTVPRSPESSSIADEPEPSTESPTEAPQIVDERTTLSQSVPEEQEVPESISEQQPSETIIPQQKEEETPAAVPELPKSSSIADGPEPSPESPAEAIQIVDDGTTLSESLPEEQELLPEGTSEQQPLETIICVCNCGVNSDLPQTCEENTSEAIIPESVNVPSTQSIDSPLVPEIEEAAGDEQSGSIATEDPSEGETSAITSKTETAIVNEEITETVAAEDIKTEANTTENVPQEEVGSNVNNESTTVIDKVATSNVTISEPELNLETSSNLPNQSDESTEANEPVSTEPESNISNDPSEVPSTTISPCTEVGDIANPNNCRKYVSCSENDTNLVSQELSCPERSAFNPVLRRCTRDLSLCVNEEPICLRAGSIPNPNGDNSSYFWCVPSLLGGFHKYHIQCSQNEVFTPLLGRCWLETPQLGLGLGLINLEPSDRDIVRAEWKLLKKEIKLKAKAEKLRKKMEEKAKARAEKLAAKELKKQKAAVRKVDDDDNDDEEDDD